jgi:DNA-binding transcriptional LysR family regulator
VTNSTSTPIGRWDGIDAFVQSVSMGSFTAAAEKLGVSKSYVSKQVGRLEDRLNARLLQRSTRHLTLTDIGEIFYRECLDISQQYEALEATVADLQNRPKGTLKLAINSRFGVQYMAGAIASFARLHSDISIQVHASYRDVDLIAEGYDLTIRYGDLDDSSLVARKLGGYTMGLYASPGYWEKYGMPTTIEDLRSHNGLCPPDRLWHFSFADGTKKIRASGNWVSEDGATLLAAAKEGLGIAQLPDFFVKNEVAAGELKKLPVQWNFYWRSAWAMYSGNQHVAAKVRFFIDFLCKNMVGEVWLEHKRDFYQRKPAAMMNT